MSALPTINPDERTAFEAWAKEFHYDLTRDDCNSDEPYVQPITDWSWLAWQAAAAGRVKVPLTDEEVFQWAERHGLHGNVVSLRRMMADAIESPAMTAELSSINPARFVVKKESGSEWARVMDTHTGMQVARYNVMPRKRSLRDGWKEATTHAAKLNAANDAKGK